MASDVLEVGQHGARVAIDGVDRCGARFQVEFGADAVVEGRAEFLNLLPKLVFIVEQGGVLHVAWCHVRCGWRDRAAVGDDSEAVSR
jgi:hypothetical protein